MAFNLNKNDGLEKKGNSKFDLSKGDLAGTTPEALVRKSGSLVYIMVGLLIVAIGGWIFFFKNEVQATQDTVLANQVREASNSSEALPAKAEETVPTTNIPEDNKTKSNKIGGVVSTGNKIPVSFASGATTFNNVNQSIVDELLSVLSANSESMVEVSGYASSEGTFEINKSISQARANAFKDYLVSKNVDESRITAVGKGIENPIASNSTELGRKKNRRVEVRLY